MGVTVAERPPEERALAAEARLKRYHRIEALIVLALCTVLVFGSIIGAVALGGQRTIKTSTHHTDCVVEALSRYEVASDAILATPPAPNAERDAAVARAQEAAHDLAEAARHC